MNRRERIMLDETGELFEEPGKMRCEWRISGFTSLSKETGKAYCSPKFYFSNVCWCLIIHPNVWNKTQLGVYLYRVDAGPPKALSFSLGFKKANGKEETIGKGDKKFSRKNHTLLGVRDFSDLLNRKSELLPLDALTVICTLKSDAFQHTESSLFRRLWNLSLRLRYILTTRNRTDVVLKLSDGEIPAHRIILESRSDVFNRMFDAGMQETQTGEVNVEDGNEETFSVVLSYLYSGEPAGLCTENMFEVYKTAHRYDLQELTKFCVDYMQECLTADLVADVIALAHLYEETTLENCAKDYFAQHKTEVFKTATWKKFESENPALSLEVVKYIFGE